ncbi:MAG TPA: amidase family protein, partial [Spirochaetota bacterium]|nr:amidase family protein [Spirochaetota bacterium]
NIISGFDPKDSTSLETTKKDYTKLIGKDIKGLKIAVLKEMFNEGIKKEIKDNFDKSVKALKDMGAIVEEISFEAIKYVISTYYFIATAEAASNLSRYDGVKYGFRSPKQANYEEMLKSTRSYGFGKEVKKRILLGNFVLSSGYYDEYYRKSQKVRSLIMGEMKKIFEKFDVIASPSTPDAAFKFGQSESDPLKIYLSDVTTVLANLSGIPAISVPSGKIDGLPIGIQFMGKPLSEEVLFQVADAFQKNVKENFTPDLSKIGSVEKNISDEKITPIEKTVEISRYSMDDIKKISNSYNDRKKFEDNRVLCDELEKNIGKKVVVKGWIHKINNLGGIEFYTLRDRTGFTQIVFEGDSNKEKINLETVVEAEGVLTKEERSPYDGIELKAQRVKILGSSNSDIPISVNGNYNNITLPTILDNRGLSLRIPKVL